MSDSEIKNLFKRADAQVHIDENKEANGLSDSADGN